MQLETRALLWDIQEAARTITSFATGKDQSDYLHDLLLRSAIERQFESAGEAMSRLAKRDPDTANRISNFRRVIGFRNVLIHGYDKIDDEATWTLIAHKVPTL